MFLFIIKFSSFQYRDVMDGFTDIQLCMVCMVSGVRFREADTCMLHPLVFNCRGWLVCYVCQVCSCYLAVFALFLCF